MGLIMECVTINPAVSLDCVIVLQSQRSSRPSTATMTSCCKRHEAHSGDQAGGFWEGLWASPGGRRIRRRSAELRAAHWCGQALVSVVLHCLGFSKTNSYWKGAVRNVAFKTSLFRRIISERQSFYEKRVMMGKKIFSLSFGIVAYEVRERENVKEKQHWKQGFLNRPSQCGPCAVIWSVRTELSRGMEKIIRRNVWGALKRSGPREWPMRTSPAERRANFFLMNSAACSTMQSDCQGWTHIWSVFGGSKWQDQFCLERKGGGGVDDY